MTLSDKSVLVVGGGAAGLTSALALADLGAAVTLVERQAALGGHAAAYACKATDACVRCGACMVASRCQAVADHPRITVRTDRRISRSNRGDQGTGSRWPSNRPRAPPDRAQTRWRPTP